MTDVLIDQTPPLIHGPSDKEKKYDRQLRLWAAAGQAALENARILLLNSGAGTVGVETLKNLILPGIGHFTIADECIVNEADLGVNFFLDRDSLGKPRAKCCVELLQELNPDVEGDWFPKQSGDTLETLLAHEQAYTLILYTLPITAGDSAKLSKYSSEHKVPLISIRSLGFHSYFRIQLPGNFPIVDTHPDSTATTDLRLLSPWPELSEFASSLTTGIEELDAHEHGHIPYLCLLLHHLATWNEEHGTYPSTYKDKVAFRADVAKGARTDNPEGGEENYEEAVAAVLKNLNSPSLASSVREVFDYKPDEDESKSHFWIITSAIKEFYVKHKALPLPGSLPDMKAKSGVYVQLQNLYKSKARQDCSEILETVRMHPNGAAIDKAEVERFCKNAAFVKLIRGVSSEPTDLAAMTKQELESDDAATMTMMPLSLLPIYFALAAVSDRASPTQSEIITAVEQLVPGLSSNSRMVQIAEEVARAQGGELHNISALTGGMAAQEIIKIITKQYIPIDNICVFDGIKSRTQVFRI